jgi:hypothetical protein
MNAKPLLTISTFTAILPLIIGSFTFWTWFFYPLRNLELTFFFTVLLSVPLCIAGLISASVFKGRNGNNWSVRRKANRNILLIFLNIPFFIFYIWFASYFIDTERITIINNGESEVTEIRIIGAGDYDRIEKIEKGASHTVWVHMTCEGSIKMIYKENGKEKERSLIGYSGPRLSGHRRTRHIIPTRAEMDI